MSELEDFVAMKAHWLAEGFDQQDKLLGELIEFSPKLKARTSTKDMKDHVRRLIGVLQAFAPCMLEEPIVASTWLAELAHESGDVSIEIIKDLLEVQKLWHEVQNYRNPFLIQNPQQTKVTL